MGTVGLSFGSPTSGAGFDVSATVSSIVANLQKVETPWKTQLSTLQSQDTAISSLGTLLSSLSNDMNALTDFTGVLAQKTGSSSDTNVVELTAATSAAMAGSHSVIVNSLAKTSSGYLAEVPSASDNLTGAITLQVGNGTAHTITLPTGGRHACQPGFGHQQFRRGHFGRHSYRLHRLATEPRFGYLRRRGQHHRHFQLPRRFEQRKCAVELQVHRHRRRRVAEHRRCRLWPALRIRRPT